MKGSIHFNKDRQQWRIAFRWHGKRYNISRYKGRLMVKTHPDNRVHLCRGHFKEYTEQNPLFGRHVGRYWWQPCVRGKKEKGIIAKDYIVDESFQKVSGTKND